MIGSLSNNVFIDAAVSLRSGRAVEASGGLGDTAGGLIQRVRYHAHQSIDTHLDGLNAAMVKARFDSAVDRINANEFRSTANEVRTDSMGAEGGATLAGAFREVMKPVLEDKHPVPNGLKYFGINSDFALGTQEFEVQRWYGAGGARVWGGDDSNIPTNSWGTNTETFRIRNYVTSIAYDVFHEMAANRANMPLATRLLKIARDTLERFTNEMTWFGDSRFGIHGVLNYPFLDKVLADDSLPFYGVPASGSQAYLDALNGWLNMQRYTSLGTFGPDRMLTTARVSDWIMQTPHGTGTSLRDRTLGEVFLSTARDKLKMGKIETAWELQDLIAPGYDGILFYRDDEYGIQNVLPGGGIQALPIFKTDIKRRQILWMPHGGVLMLESGNNLLVIVKAAA